MNEALQRIHSNEDAIRAEVDAAFEKWWAALPKFGHRQDYWNRVLSMSQEFADKHGKYGYGLALNRVQALDTEWQRLHPAHNTIMEEVFKDGQI